MYIIIDNRGAAEFPLRLSHTASWAARTALCANHQSETATFSNRSSSNECVQTFIGAPVEGGGGGREPEGTNSGVGFVVWSKSRGLHRGRSCCLDGSIDFWRETQRESERERKKLEQRRAKGREAQLDTVKLTRTRSTKQPTNQPTHQHCGIESKSVLTK